jgi:hypothetical protein
MNDEDFGEQYRGLSDEAIIQLASEGGLRPEADIALRTEMRKRSIGARQVRSLRVEERKTKLQTRVGNNPYFSYRGIGLRLRGDKFLNEADKTKEIIVATRWIVVAFMPLIPLGSYRVKYVNDNGRPIIVGKVPLQWDQVLNGWKVAALTALVFVVIFIGAIWWQSMRH